MTKEERIKDAVEQAFNSCFDFKYSPLCEYDEKEITDDIKTALLIAANKGAEAEAESKWIPCSHKDILPEGSYNLLVRDGFFESIRLFSALKGGREIPYVNTVAYNRIPPNK